MVVMSEEKLLNVPEVARLLNVSKSSLYAMTRSGRIPAIRVGSMFRFVPAEIEAWLELVAQSYNVLPTDGATFRTWARLMHRRNERLTPLPGTSTAMSPGRRVTP